METLEIIEGGLSQGYVNLSQMEKLCKNTFVWSRGSTFQGFQKASLSSASVHTQRKTRASFSPYFLPPFIFDNNIFNTTLFWHLTEAEQL